MSLAPSFSPPCFYPYGNNNNNNNNQQQLYQPHYHSFPAERRRRVTLLHAPKKQLSKNNSFTTITTTPKQQQQQQNTNNVNKKPLSTSFNKKKVVRFYDDDRLENIRLFLKTQRPLAIRDGDPALSLDLKYPNWPAKTTMSMRHLPMIRMEGVQASTSQQTTLIGRCRVANLAFEKHVVVRYTSDYWQSFHETAALYREPIGSSCNTWDRFTFFIDLEEFFIRRRCCDTTTIYLALRYTVNEKEYWDNNDGLNYQIDIIPTTHEEVDDENKEPTELITTTIIEKKSTQTYLATIEKEEGQALHRANIQKKPVKQQEEQKEYQHQQKKSITSNTASPTTSTINTITAATTNSSTSTPKVTVNNTKKKLGHRYDFGASLSEAKKTPYDVYQFGKGPMVRFSTLTKQEEDGKDGFQSRYHDFVNKYCFYGTNYSSLGSSPPSSLSCPSSEPICG